MRNRTRTRREFLKDTASAAVAGALYLHSPAKVFSQSLRRSRVVLVRNKDVLDNFNRINEKLVRQMLDDAVMTLMETKDPVQAWKKIVNPNDIVGIKSNEWRPLNTPPELENAIKQNIRKAGVPAENISIKDRNARKDPIFKRATALINVRPLRTHHWSGVGSLIKNYIVFVDDP